MDVNQLTKIIDSPGASAEERQAAREGLVSAATDERLPEAERQNALEAFKRIVHGTSGLKGIATRDSLNQLNDPQSLPREANMTTLEQQLIATTGARRLGDIEYEQIHEFGRARNWSPEAMALYQKWASNNPETLHTILRLYLTMHGESRNEAKFLLKNLNGRWPAHWVDRKALEAFIQRKPECEDARRVVQHFLDHGEAIEHLPMDCDCWKLRDAIRRAANEKNPQILIDYLSEKPEVVAANA